MQVIYHLCSKKTILMQHTYPAFSSGITQKMVIKTTLSVP